MSETEPSNSLPLNLTPMLTQYLEIKRQYPDCILFYRMGDFYEMFLEDALTAAPVLEVQLTSRDKNSAQPIPMCGIPHHAVTGYMQKLLAKGFKVALCEQMEDPQAAKGLVKRGVVRVVTPALIGDPELVPDETRNILLCLLDKEAGAVEVCALDLLGGEVRLGTLDRTEKLLDLFCEWQPKEILLPEALADAKWLRDLLKIFPGVVLTRRNKYFETKSTFSALVDYLKETQKLDELPYLGEPLALFEAQSMRLDAVTLAALEVVKGPQVTGTTLFEVLDSTLTPMGRRLLRDWLAHPLTNVQLIRDRLDAVKTLFGTPALAEALRAPLTQIRDLERLTTKTALGLAMPRDLVAVRAILGMLPEIQRTLQDCPSDLLRGRAAKLSLLPELTGKLESALEDEPPATLRDGGIFRDGFHPDIAEYRSLTRDAKGTIAAIETREKERTGIPSLKLKYSRVFGYTIEITKSHLGKVPKDYIRKQTIANGERFITEELKKLEDKIITADHKLKTLEESLFLELRTDVAAAAPQLMADSKILAELDVLLTFARQAAERDYRCPEIHEGDEIDIVDGRHPVIETLLPQGAFVPNSVTLSDAECRTLIITGPNMAGKSTIMRQVALISLMAQAGSFVPAASARLPLVDAIFTRIGSSDDLTRGRSTFMVEMSEVARILEKGTPRSLVLIDEIGRGTSTYDGLSLAWSILEYLHVQVRAKTLFATHFHELTSLEKSLTQLKNVNVLVERWKDEIVFLHKLGPGICSQSYGVEVAKLAGLPPKVLLRAKEILGLLETHSQRATRTRNKALEVHDNQLLIFDEQKSLENRDTVGS